MDDAAVVQRLAGDARIADTAVAVPHPYEDGMAESWIATHQPAFEAGTHAHFAITLRGASNPAEGNELVGAIEIRFQQQGHVGDIGYWVGVPHWNRGYCTEALVALIDYGFGERDLLRIGAHHSTRNPSSGRVMTKAGMKHEAHLREHLFARGCMEDIEIYGILRREWEAARSVDPGI